MTPPLRARAGLIALAVYPVALILFGVWVPELRALSAGTGFNLERAYRPALIAGALVALAVAVRPLARSPLRRLGGLVVVAALAWLALEHGPTAPAAGGRLAEQTHLVQYGLLGLLWSTVMRERCRNGELYGLGLVFIAAVGLLDELVQWWVPERVGTLLDVRIDLLGGVLGLALARLVLFAGEPRRAWGRAGQIRLFRSAAMVVVLLGAFVHIVHLGVSVPVAEVGARFRSRVDAAALAARNQGWRPRPESSSWVVRALRGEDFHLVEARYHARLRNDLMLRARTLAAFQHQVILERFYSSCVAVTPGLALPAEARAALAAAEARAAQAAYDAGPPELVTALDAWTWWLAVVLVASAALSCAELLELIRAGATSR